MNRLSAVLTLMSGSGLVRGFVTVFLSLGFYIWLPFTIVAGAGLLLTWPAAEAISRRIRRDDRDRTPHRGRHRQHDDAPESPEP